MKLKKSIVLSLVAIIFTGTVVFGQNSDKLVSAKTQIKFFSSTPAEDIEAQNTTSVSTINKETGEVVFSVPMQGFEFEKSLMQKHFNSDNFLDTKTYPKAKLTGKIINPEAVDFSKDGSYQVAVEGELTLKGVTNSIKEKGTININGGQINVESVFNITLADYGVSFVDGKPSTNIAKTVEVTVQSQYQAE
ncbi:MAG: YceI family protein [Bacteroidia bacterium]|nr:MAG: YceI family protein [Bacteroidia bacterium]